MNVFNGVAHLSPSILENVIYQFWEYQDEFEFVLCIVSYRILSYRSVVYMYIALHCIALHCVCCIVCCIV